MITLTASTEPVNTDPHPSELPVNGFVYDPTTDDYLNLTPADVEPIGPDDDDARWLAEQNTDWHSEEPTQDFDAMADEAMAQSHYEAGYGFC